VKALCCGDMKLWEHFKLGQQLHIHIPQAESQICSLWRKRQCHTLWATYSREEMGFQGQAEGVQKDIRKSNRDRYAVQGLSEKKC
jgi:hypothetical protein